MSGLEALGAAASIFGVISAVKTCVDLLDIISTARSAQRDLEDLLVLLQWQRIRFFSWVLETGFANAIDAGARNGLQTQSISNHQMLAMLPREFRLPFFLEHIERTITNMRSRLQATEQIIQRYCAIEKTQASSAGGSSWTERMAYFLDRRPAPELSSSLSLPSQRGHPPRTPPATAAAEIRKLALWDKVRWVSGDLKELKHLLDTLQQYNTQLADMLPPSKSRSFGRRVERELTVSPGMSSQLAALETGSDGPVEDPTERRQARYYRALISLLERHDESRVEASKDTRDDKEREMVPSNSSLSRHSPPVPLHLSLAGMKVANFPTSGAADREFVSYNQIPAIVEWRYYPKRISAQGRSYIDARVHSLSMQLAQLSAVSDTGLLSCLGYVYDEANSRYGSLFAYPPGCSGSSRPMSLQECLRRDHEKRVRRELKERFDLARTLILALYRLLSVNWLHRNLSSESLLLFNDDRGQAADGGSGACQLFVCGFIRSRRDSQLELSEKTPTESLSSARSGDKRLYWHPGRVVLFEAAAANHGSPANAPSFDLLAASYRREFDVYSLGILLLEIGFWCPISRIFRDSKSQSSAAFASELRTRYVPELEGRMGKMYAQIVAYCLGQGSVNHTFAAANGTSSDEYLSQTKRFLETFEEKVVAKIEGPYLGLE